MMRSIDFADAVRGLGVVARRAGLKVPGYRGVRGGEYEIVERASGAFTVTVDHDRPPVDVLLDMVRGLLDANADMLERERT